MCDVCRPLVRPRFLDQEDDCDRYQWTRLSGTPSRYVLPFPKANSLFSSIPDSKNADDKLEDSTTLSIDTPRPASAELLFLITSFIAKSVLPSLRRFLLENDKVIANCNNIVYYIVNPAMRGKTRYGVVFCNSPQEAGSSVRF